MKSMLRKTRFARRGTAAVEAAVMAPLVVTAMLGMMEVGYVFMIRQSVTLAAREGARAASLPGGTLEDVEAAVDTALEGPGLQGYTVTSNIKTLASTDTEVWVKVSIPFSRVSFTGNLLGGGSFDIASTTTMRREGVDESDD